MFRYRSVSKIFYLIPGDLLSLLLALFYSPRTLKPNLLEHLVLPCSFSLGFWFWIYMLEELCGSYLTLVMYLLILAYFLGAIVSCYPSFL